MSRDKQIEEMAKIVLQEPHIGGLYGFDERIASRLYNAGYRKSQDVAEEIFAEIEKHLIFNTYGIATISDKTFAELKKKYESEGTE